ncbi:MAG: prepilin-type cleavage/methylation domain-containing protein, partial [Armatimonadetes bacterium CG_4_9_14_3_um_filter_66_14]
MLVVIGIIAVLAAIIVPVYNGVAEKADKVKCAAHLQQVGIAQTMYRNDKKRHAASLFEVAAGGYL